MPLRDLACTLTDMQMTGELPLWVTHNDAKINNKLFYPPKSNTRIVIDLDAVMLDLMGHDFGDTIRFAANFVEEDCRDLDKVDVDPKVFQGL